jgi:SAM-dependent methyltransferase
MAQLNKTPKLPKFYKTVQNLNKWISIFGFDLRKFVAIRGLLSVIKEYRLLKKQNNNALNKWIINFVAPNLSDRYEASGVALGHYFHQDLLVARRIFQRNPIKHVDVGSRVETFVAHVATFRQIEILDIRPLISKTDGISFRQCDLMNLPVDLIESCDSVSCLHALEHFGLGRYGDSIDINGYLQGFDNLCKILKPDGILYLSFPIGTQRIEFNSHRVFFIQTPLNWAMGRFELIEFSYVDDRGDLHLDQLSNIDSIAARDDLHYGCGIYEFKKI